MTGKKSMALIASIEAISNENVPKHDAIVIKHAIKKSLVVDINAMDNVDDAIARLKAEHPAVPTRKWAGHPSYIRRVFPYSPSQKALIAELDAKIKVLGDTKTKLAAKVKEADRLEAKKRADRLAMEDEIIRFWSLLHYEPEFLFGGEVIVFPCIKNNKVTYNLRRVDKLVTPLS